MSNDTSPFGFGRFVPGFDFLQNLTKSATTGAAAIPGLSNWVAPTVSVEELDKRITELKSVQYWLEQNSRALAATVQALEVQKMTLATLNQMNVAVGDLAGAFSANVAAAAEPHQPAARSAKPTAAAAPQPAPAAEKATAASPESEASAGAAGVADPLQWWTALTTQFQQIASHAMQDATQNQQAMEATRDMAKGAFKAASDMASQFASQAGPAAAAAAAAAASASAAAPKAAAAPAAAKKPRAAAKKTAAAPRAPSRSAGSKKSGG